MGAQSSFEYAIVRVVPRVEREEFINAGVIVFCHDRDFLAARAALEEARLLALSPDIDVAMVRRHLEAIARVCEGGPLAGPIGRLTLRERWQWLIAPRSTILQTSPAHTGLGEVSEQLLQGLLDRVVRAPAPAPP